MSLTLLGVDTYDIEGYERLKKYLEIVQPNKLILNITSDDFGQDLKYLKQAKEYVENEIDSLPKKYLKTAIKKYIDTSNFVTLNAINYYKTRANHTTMLFTNIPLEPRLPKLPLNMDSKKFYTNLLATSYTIAKLIKEQRVKEYGTFSQTITVKDRFSIPDYSQENIEKLAKSIEVNHNNGDTTTVIGHQIPLIEYTDLSDRIKHLNPHKVSLEDMDNYL